MALLDTDSGAQSDPDDVTPAELKDQQVSACLLLFFFVLVQDRVRRRLKNQKKKLSKKRRNKPRSDPSLVPDSGLGETEDEEKGEGDSEVEIEYVGGDMELNQTDPNYSYFARVFQTFKVLARSPSRDLLADRRRVRGESR